MLQIATLNLAYYSSKHGSWEKRQKLIVDQFRKINPHIIALQAVSEDFRLQPVEDQALQLCGKLEGFQFHFFQQAQTHPDGFRQGSAIISRLPMIEEKSRNLTLLSGNDDTNQRIIQQATFGQPGAKLRLYNGHFSWVEEQAKVNVNEALEFMNEDDTGPAILAGDLNTLPGSPVFKPLHQAGYMDAWEVANNGAEGFTFEADKPSMRIDYFWLSASLADRVRTVRLIHPPAGSSELFSDHLGLAMALDMWG